MNNENQPEKLTINGWTFRVKLPPEQIKKPSLLLLLHGHLGNENAMWILTNPLSDSCIMLAPRAPVKIGPDQYSWHEIEPEWPDLDFYLDLSNQLMNRIEMWMEQNAIKIDYLNVMGFSQGAVMAYALAFLNPDRFRKIAALASFIPQSRKNQVKQGSISHQKFFIAHGTQDTVVPIGKARQAAAWLESHGANVTFCEAETGHKLSANCLKGLGDFFR